MLQSVELFNELLPNFSHSEHLYSIYFSLTSRLKFHKNECNMKYIFLLCLIAS